MAFGSYASNLVAGDTNGEHDVFVRDRSTGETTRVSRSTAGVEANSYSAAPSLSANGRFVAFHSFAWNLVDGDTNQKYDVFVHDRTSGTTVRVSRSTAGLQGNNNSIKPAISADGRFVAFTSEASDLVAGDTNETADIFVHDRTTGMTTRVSLNSSGVQGNGVSYNPSISADGRFVAFTSGASNLVLRDTNGELDIFVHDRSTGRTTRVSRSSSGVQGNRLSEVGSISANGRFVAFESPASNLVPGDTNENADIFVHDRSTGKTTRVSRSSAGLQSRGNSIFSSISANGRFVAFDSYASNLVVGDTNHQCDVFLHDRSTGKTIRASRSTAGVQGRGRSWWPKISADGRFVAFDSDSSNLVRGDTNGSSDIFLFGPVW